MPSLVNVIAIHPDSHSVDVELPDGRQFFAVPVLSQSASANSGSHNLPSLDDNNIVVAVIDYFDGEIPFVNGFVYPQVAQNLFSANRALNRHHSGAYTSINDTGEMEVFHPSGAYLRLAESDKHEDLTGKDYDGKFKNTKNTDRTLCFTIGFVGNPTKIKISKDGKVEITSDLALTGKINSTDTIHSNSDIIADDVSLKHHTHEGSWEPD